MGDAETIQKDNPESVRTMWEGGLRGRDSRAKCLTTRRLKHCGVELVGRLDVSICNALTGP